MNQLLGTLLSAVLVYGSLGLSARALFRYFKRRGSQDPLPFPWLAAIVIFLYGMFMLYGMLTGFP